jgi:hypothetical protein
MWPEKRICKPCRRNWKRIAIQNRIPYGIEGFDFYKRVICGIITASRNFGFHFMEGGASARFLYRNALQDSCGRGNDIIGRRSVFRRAGSFFWNRTIRNSPVFG